MMRFRSSTCWAPAGNAASITIEATNSMRMGGNLLLLHQEFSHAAKRQPDAKRTGTCEAGLDEPSVSEEYANPTRETRRLRFAQQSHPRRRREHTAVTTRRSAASRALLR